MDSGYKFENLKLTGRVCKTNTPSNTAYRGFGTPQGMLVTETVLDEISIILGVCTNEVKQPLSLLVCMYLLVHFRGIFNQDLTLHGGSLL